MGGGTLQNYAILIDGGFAKRRLGPPMQPAEASDYHRLIDQIVDHPALQREHLHRIYYYDSIPLETAHDKPLGGGKIEFGNQPQVARAKQLFEQLSRMPLWALRLGELAFQGWKLGPRTLRDSPGPKLEIGADDLYPQITQKGVDMRIGMDIAALTLKKQVQVIVLVTGDSDFVPAMKFARREGAQLFLVPLGSNLKRTMYEHSDMVLEVEYRRPPPARIGGQGPAGPGLTRGSSAAASPATAPSRPAS